MFQARRRFSRRVPSRICHMNRLDFRSTQPLGGNTARELWVSLAKRIQKGDSVVPFCNTLKQGFQWYPSAGSKENHKEEPILSFPLLSNHSIQSTGFVANFVPSLWCAIVVRIRATLKKERPIQEKQNMHLATARLLLRCAVHVFLDICPTGMRLRGNTQAS